MAQNYTLSEAVQIAAKKENVEAMNDLGRRYPLLMAKVYAVLAKAGDDAVDLLSYIPEKVSANKVNVQIKAAMLGGAEETEEGSDNPEDTVADEKKTMTKAERAKARREARKAAKAKTETADEEGDDSEETEESDNPYEGKNAMELFKMCKERGIAAKPKRSAKFYADLLIKADAEAGEENTDPEEDDWADDEEEQEEKPAKKTSKKAPAKKATSKKAKAAEEDEDEDEDWDI